MKAPDKTKKQVSDAKSKRRRSLSKKNTKSSGQATEPQSVKTKDNGVGPSFPVVGMGASAGGLEAFEQFFIRMPPDSGMAFVLVQHLDPTHKSILSELIQRYTSMRVTEVEDGMPVEPNTVFVIPPNRYMAINNGKLHLLEPIGHPRVRTPIDYFFRSLAQDRKERAIGIVLSGTGSEGALGLRAVKGEGGMAMVQDPGSAKYDGMPRNALGTGLVDYVLPPEKMPEQLIVYAKHAFVMGPRVVDKPASVSRDLLQKVFILIRAQTGHDFSLYKQSTIVRRVERRMAVHQLSRLSDYVRYMQTEPGEAGILLKELLIGVTNFFRDKEAFESLKAKVIAKIFENRSPEDGVRIWVPGCATGEEAYSIAMLCRDVMSELQQNIPIQIFATDIDSNAIETARAGVYPDSISADVPQEFLTRFFTREDSSFRINKEIRAMIVFALQNVIADPPFSHLDLISCRNLLIYLGSELQRRVLPIFSHALRKDGILFLGSSETIGEFTDLFDIVDRKWKLFKRKDSELTEGYFRDFQVPTPMDRRVEAMVAGRVTPPKAQNYREVAESIILEKYGPVGVIIDQQSKIVYIHGKTGKYLEPALGEPSFDILAMARESLRLELATAIRKSITQQKEIRIDRVPVKTNGEDRLVNLVVKPITEPASLKGMLMVIFEEPIPDAVAVAKAEKSNKSIASHPRIRLLEQELSSTKEHLQTIVEELETSNEDLKSTNEELSASNEELQSSNEECETSKEELQSVNEELVTLNFEYQHKIDELSEVTGYLNNLLSSTEIGTIFLDTDLKINRFTPAATDILNLLPTDIGRPVSHLTSNMFYGGLVEDAKRVLKTLVSKEVEIETKDHRWHIMRILPYRNVQNVVDGVVVNFVDVTHVKRAEKDLDESRKHLAIMTSLQKIGALFVGENDLQKVLTEIVDAAVAITFAEKGSIHLLDRQSNSLNIIAHRGFAQPWLDFRNQVHEGQGAGGIAVRTGKRIIVEDVAESPLFKGTPGLDVDLAAGVRAIQSTPLVGRSGKVLGVLTTYFSRPHRPDEENLQRLDLLVRQATDIIERAEAEDDLRLMAIIVRDSNDAITVQDLKGSILKWNSGARRMYGWNEVEAVGMNIMETIPKDKEAEYKSFMDRLIAGEEIQSFQTQRRTKDGKVLDVWLTVTRITDREGNIMAIATTERDITELSGTGRKKRYSDCQKFCPIVQ